MHLLEHKPKPQLNNNFYCVGGYEMSVIIQSTLKLAQNNNDPGNFGIK
jgi:hypothetical protein